MFGVKSNINPTIMNRNSFVIPFYRDRGLEILIMFLKEKKNLEYK